MSHGELGIGCADQRAEQRVKILKENATQSRVGRREGGAIVEDLSVFAGGEIRSIGNLSQPAGWDIAHGLTPNSRQQGTALILEPRGRR